ncbi:MAG: transglutaminase-like domain-containing protein, partial [Phycisphaerae bacterium]|nr:transglutaminase-like domain-containing protein [Phycisphaerae bacterium]
GSVRLGFSWNTAGGFWSNDALRAFRLLGRCGGAALERGREMNGKANRRVRVFAWCLSVVLISVAICGEASGQGTIRGLPTPPKGSTRIDRYYEIWMGEAKLGYARTAEWRVGKEIHTCEILKMSMSRGKVRLLAEQGQFYVESLDGKPLRAKFVTMIATTRITRTVTVGAEEVKIVEEGGSIRRQLTLPREADLLFSAAVRKKTLELCRKGSGTFSYKALTPSLFGVVYSALENRYAGPAEVDVMGSRRKATKLVQTTTTGMITRTGAEYVDESGYTLVVESPAEGIRLVAASPTVARARGKPAELMGLMLIKAGGTRPPRGKAVRLTIRPGTDAQARKVLVKLPETATQKVVKRGLGFFVLELFPPQPPKSYKLPSRDGEMRPFLTPTLYLASDDKVVARHAAKAIGSERDAAKAARKLRDWVHRSISKKNLSVGFATASEVAKNLEGDCTEHAVLLAAMGRAVGLPSRLAVGLMYADEFAGHKRVFGYHMWTQFYIGGWVDYDASARGGYGANPHIAVGFLSLASSEPPDALWPVLRLIQAKPDIDFAGAEAPADTPDNEAKP